MTDRVPGAPGQYKAVLSAEALAAMQAGEQFTITLTRDDQPITEGTPYSKAAVLPDELATRLGLDIKADPTPAEALAALLPLRGGTMLGHLDMGGNQIKNVHNVVTTFLNGTRVRSIGQKTSSHTQTLERGGYSAYLFVAYCATSNGTGGGGCAYFVTVEQGTTTYKSHKIYGEETTNLAFACPNAEKLNVILPAFTIAFVISLDSVNA